MAHTRDIDNRLDWSDIHFGRDCESLSSPLVYPPPPTQSTRATATTQQSPTAQTQQTHARRPLLASTLTRLSAAFAASPRACASQEEVLCLHSSHVVEVVDIARATVVAVVDLRSCCSLYYGLVPTLQCQTGSTNAHTHTHTHTHAHTRTHTHM